MGKYFIGDVQGCYAALMRLLDVIHFDPASDQLGFVGDLVNRGPDSLKVLRFIRSLQNPIVLLGNHDLHLLAVGYGAAAMHDADTFQDVLQADDCHDLLEWLRQQRLFYHEDDFCVVHAGIPPQWTVTQTQQYANELQDVLRGNQHLNFLKQMHGNCPDSWSESLEHTDRLRYITNALTRMRLCTAEGTLDLKTKSKTSSQDPHFKPWFDWPTPNTNIIFGHWAALEGKCQNPRCFAIDTGCIWGGPLTALATDNHSLIQASL